MKSFLYYFFNLLLMSTSVLAKTEVKIVELTGDVRVRYGLNEEWHKAAVGDVLKDIDTIFNGENAHSTLKLNDGSSFQLGANSVLDISDLRIILEKEMFLILMSKKVEKIEDKNTKTELRVGNVSVLHGLNAAEREPENLIEFQKAWSAREINGARALYEQNYFSNSIIKFYSILSRYDTLANQETIYLYMARGFEELDKKGQAIDAYQKLINILTTANNHSGKNTHMIEAANEAIEKLSN
jgi:hypothetical protein